MLAAALASLPLLLALPGSPWRVAPEAAQPAGQPSVSDTPHGRAAAAFVAMINDGSADAVGAFEREFRSRQASQTVALGERVARVAEMHAELAPLSIARVLDGGTLTLVAHARDGRSVVMEVVPATDSPERIDGVRMRIGGPEVEPVSLSENEVAAAVERAATALEAGYVYPEVGRKMADRVRTKLASGGYGSVADDASLASALTRDLREVSRDLHLGVRDEPGASESAEPDEGQMLRELAADNYGFREVRVLPGNIGYIRFDAFVPGPGAEATGAGAMAFVRNCDAVVFDLRSNGGGSPEMIRFLTSYLFDTPTHLNDMVDRNGEVVEEYWTLEDAPGERLGEDVPVFVLTSGHTFSGAEEFSYNLKNLGRATIVGEQTGGGAHPVRPERISERLVIGIPYMRAQNPITKDNWEGVGVEPDVDVPAPEALDRAIELAREAIEAGG